MSICPQLSFSSNDFKYTCRTETKFLKRTQLHTREYTVNLRWHGTWDTFNDSLSLLALNCKTKSKVELKLIRREVRKLVHFSTSSSNKLFVLSWLRWTSHLKRCWFCRHRALLVAVVRSWRSVSSYVTLRENLSRLPTRFAYAIHPRGLPSVCLQGCISVFM